MEEREKLRRDRKTLVEEQKRLKEQARMVKNLHALFFLYFGSAFLSVKFHPLNNRLEEIVC